MKTPYPGHNRRQTMETLGYIYAVLRRFFSNDITADDAVELIRKLFT